MQDHSHFLHILIFALAIFSVPASAQDTSETKFTIVEVMPSFPGGDKKLFKFLSKNIKYPKQAIDQNISGVVYISFVVEKDGSISNARVIRGIGGGCDEEALRVVNSMPRWSPGYQRGKPVQVQFNMPIRFNLGKKKKKKQA